MRSTEERLWRGAALVPLAVLGAAVSLAAAHGPRRGPSEELRVTTVATQEPLPSRGRLGGVSVDAAGNVYVANFGASLFRVAPNGAVERLLGNLRGSSGNTVASDGAVYQASFVDGRIVRLPPAGGAETWVSDGLAGPVGLTEGADGALYVCNCKRNDISRVGRDRSVTAFASSPDFDCPNGITRDVDGSLVVVSFKNGHLVRIDRDGRTTRLVTLPERGNAHVAATPEALWVTKIEANRVYRVGRDGGFERWAGNGALGFQDGARLAAPLARPNGIAVTADGRALIVDTLRGTWRGESETEIVLRRLELPPSTTPGGEP